MNELEQISPKMRGSRKYNCKKGGVDCEVSRRERDIPNTFWTDHLFPSVLTSSLLFRRTQFNIQSNGKEENSLEESFTSISQKCLRILFWPPPSNFFLQPYKTRILTPQPHVHHPSTMNHKLRENVAKKELSFRPRANPLRTEQSKLCENMNSYCKTPIADNSRH